MFSIPADYLDVSLKILTSAFLGGLIGLERESNGKDAGVRTYSLVCLGSALVMIVSFGITKGQAGADPSRIAAQVVSGIGFLGAGAILRSEKGSIKGLTTAAGIWTAAGIGLACGLGMYYAAMFATGFTLFILVVFSRVDRLLGGKDY